MASLPKLKPTMIKMSSLEVAPTTLDDRRTNGDQVPD